MKTRLFRPALVISMLVTASLSCQAVTSLVNGGTATEVSPTSVSVPTVDNGNVAVPTSTSTGSSSGSQSTLLKDDFSDSSSGWGTGTDADSTVEYVDGGLHMQVFKTNFITWSNPDQQSYEDVHMEVTVNNKSGQSRAAFGVLCNQQVTDSAYYYFAISADGEYVIGKSAVAQKDVFLTGGGKWATSDLIAKDAPSYQVGADCANGNLVLYVDGKKIDSATDSSYTKGGVGLFLWSGDDPSGEVTYDDFSMTSLK